MKKKSFKEQEDALIGQGVVYMDFNLAQFTRVTIAKAYHRYIYQIRDVTSAMFDIAVEEIPEGANPKDYTEVWFYDLTLRRQRGQKKPPMPVAEKVPGRFLAETVHGWCLGAELELLNISTYLNQRALEDFGLLHQSSKLIKHIHGVNKELSVLMKKYAFRPKIRKRARELWRKEHNHH